MQETDQESMFQGKILWCLNCNNIILLIILCGSLYYRYKKRENKIHVSLKIIRIKEKIVIFFLNKLNKIINKILVVTCFKSKKIVKLDGN